METESETRGRGEFTPVKTYLATLHASWRQVLCRCRGGSDLHLWLLRVRLRQHAAPWLGILGRRRRVLTARLHPIIQWRRAPKSAPRSRGQSAYQKTRTVNSAMYGVPSVVMLPLGLRHQQRHRPSGKAYSQTGSMSQRYCGNGWNSCSLVKSAPREPL